MFGTLGKKEGIKKEDIENEEEKNLASAAAPILREVENPILKKIFGGRKRRT